MPAGTTVSSEGIFGFDPRSIPSCIFWFDGSDSNTITTFNSSVSQWRDKSGNNRHASQGTGASQPTSSGNGIVFNGSQFLQIPRAAGTIANTPFTLFFVERLNSTANCYLFGDQNVNQGGATNSSLHIGYRNSTNFTMAFYGNDLEITGISGTGATRIWACILPPSSLTAMAFIGRTVRLNGSNIGVSNANFSFLTAFTAPVIGQVFNGNFYNGSIFEILGYTGNITLNQIQQVEGYLAWKWGLQTSLPATHPFRNSRTLVRAFQPVDIANCALWLDATDPRVFTFSSGSNVSQWRDKSLSRATAISYIYGNGSITWDGQSVIFNNNGSTGFSATNNALMQLNQNIQTTPDYTVIAAVLGSNVAGNAQRIMAIYANPRNPIPYVAGQLDNRAPNFGFGNSFEFSYNNPGSANSGMDITPPTNVITITSMTSGTSNLLFHFNGGLYSNISRTWQRWSVDGNYLPWIGGTRIIESNVVYDNRFFNGRIYELIVYNQALSDNDRKTVEGYLGRKYNLGQFMNGASPQVTTELQPNDASISSSLRIWNDATSYSTNGQTLTSWINKGDASITLTCTGNPTVLTNQLNGLPIVRFTTAQTWNNTAVNYSAYTIFFVGRQNGGTNGRVLRSSTNNQLYGYWNGRKRVIYVDGNPDWIQFPLSDTNWDIMAFSRTAGGSWNFYWNGVIQWGAPSSVSTNLTGIDINSSEPSACDVAEIIVYNTVLTPTQIRQINVYLSNKWALTLDTITNPFSYTMQPTSPLLLNPQQVFPVSPVLWMDASQETYADGATVTSATDRSGSGYSIVPVAGNTITYVQRGLNGMSVYNFGANRMQIANFVWRTKFTIAFVVRANAGSFLFSQWTTGYTNYVFTGNCALIMVNSNGIAFNDSAWGSCGGNTISNTWVIVILQYGNIGNPAWRLNGTARTTFQNGGSRQGVVNVTATAFINGNGSSQFDTSQVAEIIFFNDFLDSNECQQVEGYLAWKWGLKNSLPTTHPYYLFSPSSLLYVPIVATGGDFVVNANGFTYHVFTQNGTFTITSGNGILNYLLVGGGGGGGDRHGGGGGAGSVVYGQQARLQGNFSVTVGGGGAAGNYESGGLSPAGIGGKGGDTQIGQGTPLAIAYGGIGGGTYDGNPNTSLTPFYGSGGGGGGTNLPGLASGINTYNGLQNAGGAGSNPGAGGGGGAGGAGSAANTSTGGPGTGFFSPHLLAVGYGTIFATSPQSPISGGIAYIGGGGGGAANTGTAPTSRAGGIGGGGTGDWDDAVITAGTANTGGGGGGSRSNNTGTTGRAGGSGLVIIWY